MIFLTWEGSNGKKQKLHPARRELCFKMEINTVEDDVILKICFYKLINTAASSPPSGPWAQHFFVPKPPTLVFPAFCPKLRVTTWTGGLQSRSLLGSLCHRPSPPFTSGPPQLQSEMSTPKAFLTLSSFIKRSFDQLKSLPQPELPTSSFSARPVT